ncbi:hypothetical protein PHLCEN_2v12435 [Hermanssonia centrifuga]|uniref:Reverse transcriptase Ty1/copia-type domain-containing protein n=1 Tax=Hermanssonia centrifuga TaxID=98765 RepID=A0A2R6NH50_9APHY|nr:hypothetical protein PHLCEN_2v12435 [Hermanssonia centrifuga]
MAAVMGDVEGLEPTLEEAQKQLDWPKWLATIKAKLKSLNSNDICETFFNPPHSPIATRNGWAIESFDFNSAYLNSVLDDDEVVYLEKPPQFAAKDPKQYVLWLRTYMV